MKLSEHFSAEEIGYYEIPAEFRPNALAVVALLERVRVTWGAPIIVGKRIYRSPVRNASLTGASATSQHLDATAADINPLGLSYARALELVEQDMALRQMFGQFIAYRSASHFHISLPTRGKVGEILEQTSEDAGAPVYVAIAPATKPNGILADAPVIAAGLAAAGVLVFAVTRA